MPRKVRKLSPIPALPNDSQAQSTWALAHSYSLAAAALQTQTEVYVQQPVVFLLLHSLELFLKSFLILHGISEVKLRGLGHDLVACMRACKAHGLSEHVSLSSSSISQVVRVNRFYSDKELEYFSPRAKRFGNIENLDETVGTVAKGVLGAVFGKAWQALYRQQPNPSFKRTPDGAA